MIHVLLILQFIFMIISLLCVRKVYIDDASTGYEIPIEIMIILIILSICPILNLGVIWAFFAEYFKDNKHIARMIIRKILFIRDSDIERK